MTAEIAWRGEVRRLRIAPDKALATMRDAIALQPKRLDFRLTLARLLLNRGRYGEVDAALASETAAAADHLRAWAALERGDHARAIALFEKLGHENDLATALLRAGRLGEAAAVACKGLARRAGSIACARVAGNALLALDRAAEAYDIARDAWARGGRNVQLIWMYAAAARALGREAEFKRLTAREPWFASMRLDIDNEALAREVLGAQTLAPVDAHRPARGRVLRIDDFDSDGGPASHALHEAVRGAIARYRSERLHHADHPLIGSWPARMSLESWAMAMQDDGFEDWHIHAGAWLSAVYYVRNPARALGGEAGRIGFGALPEMTGALAMDTWTVTPEPGLLVLFPAWYAHRTWPTGRETERISIAFNAVRDATPPSSPR
jgi:putative 2-oxoglutarate-Fe(II)-dependent oxygenase superfamily protein